jgi:hypothetical protein
MDSMRPSFSSFSGLPEQQVFCPLCELYFCVERYLWNILGDIRENIPCRGMVAVRGL